MLLNLLCCFGRVDALPWVGYILPFVLIEVDDALLCVVSAMFLFCGIS